MNSYVHLSRNLLGEPVVVWVPDERPKHIDYPASERMGWGDDSPDTMNTAFHVLFFSLQEKKTSDEFCAALAWCLHEQYARDVLAKLPPEGGTITSDSARDYVLSHLDAYVVQLADADAIKVFTGRDAITLARGQYESARAGLPIGAPVTVDGATYVEKVVFLNGPMRAYVREE